MNAGTRVRLPRPPSGTSAGRSHIAAAAVMARLLPGRGEVLGRRRELGGVVRSAVAPAHFVAASPTAQPVWLPASAGGARGRRRYRVGSARLCGCGRRGGLWHPWRSGDAHRGSRIPRVEGLRPLVRAPRVTVLGRWAESTPVAWPPGRLDADGSGVLRSIRPRCSTSPLRCLPTRKATLGRAPRGPGPSEGERSRG